MADNSKLFKLEVISPERVFYIGDADMVEVKTSEGEMGVYKHHIPLTAVIVPGILNIKMDGKEKKAALHDGFIQILGDRIIVLSESCEWPEEIDVNRAKESRIRAERRLKRHDGEINVARAELALSKSLIRIELAEKYSKH